MASLKCGCSGHDEGYSGICKLHRQKIYKMLAEDNGRTVEEIEFWFNNEHLAFNQEEFDELIGRQ